MERHSANSSPALVGLRFCHTVDDVSGFFKFFSPAGTAALSLFTSGKYVINPELRGAEFERITQNLDLHFWKSFWNITESDILSVGRGQQCLFL